MGNYVDRIRGALATNTLFNSDLTDLRNVIDRVSNSGISTFGLTMLAGHVEDTRSNLPDRLAVVEWARNHSGEFAFDVTPFIGSVIGETRRIITECEDALNSNDNSRIDAASLECINIVANERGAYDNAMALMLQESYIQELDWLINQPLGGAILSAMAGPVLEEVLEERAMEINKINGFDAEEYPDDGSIILVDPAPPSEEDCATCK